MAKRPPKPAGMPTVSDIIKTLGFSERSVRAWFRGERSIPILKLQAILHAFPYVDARWLVDEFSRRWTKKAPPNALGLHINSDEGIGAAIRAKRTIRGGHLPRPPKAKRANLPAP